MFMQTAVVFIDSIVHIYFDGLCVTLKSINLPLNHLMPISEIKFIAKFGFGVCNAFIVAR